MKLSYISLICGSLIIVTCLLLLGMGLFEREVPGWGFDVSRNTLDYLKRYSPPNILPEHFCEQNPHLLIIVFSAPDNFDDRKAIRETWGSGHMDDSVSVSFLIGETSNSSIQRDISLESIQFGDIIQENFFDSYYNLTLKSIYMLKVSVRYCANTAKFLLKTDDDMFVNVPKLMEVLRQITNPKDLLLGRKACGTKPIKDIRSKWYIPKYMYSEEMLPNFLSGTGYLMSLDVAERLYAVAKFTPILHLEDVYITGICAKNAGIVPQHNGGFTYDAVPNEPCVLKNLITVHQFSPDRMRATLEELGNRKIVQKCENYKPMFNAPLWLLANIFMPSYRLCRRRVCQ